MEVRKAYKYRMYPSKTIEKRIDDTIETCRQLYNASIFDRRKLWETEQKTASTSDQYTRLVKGQRQENEYIDAVYSQVLNDVFHRVDRNYRSFFAALNRYNSKPNGKSPPCLPKPLNRDRYRSFTYPQGGFNLEGKYLILSKIGRVKLKLHRPVEGDIKTLTISRKNGKYYAVFSCVVEARQLPRTKKDVGIDVGVTKFCVTSDGHVVASLKPYASKERKLKQLQKSFSRKKRGSNRRQKAKQALSKQHENVANSRKNLAFTTANWLLSRYDTTYHEDLKIKEMIGGRMSKSINDAAWGEFFRVLHSQADNTEGKSVIAVPAKNTTQTCSQCWRKVPKKLSERKHSCPYCGLEIDRDLNAARNILAYGRGELSLALSIPDNEKDRQDRQREEKPLAAD